MKNLNLYTAKVANVTNFGDSISLLMVIKTCNGRVCEPVWVQKSISVGANMADKIIKGTEVGFTAQGRSREPVKYLPRLDGDGGNGQAVHALAGFEVKSLTIILPGVEDIVSEEAEASEETIRRTGAGIASRALDLASALMGKKKAQR